MGRVRGVLGPRAAVGALSGARRARPARAVDPSVQDAREAGQPARLVALPRAHFVEVRAVRPAVERLHGPRADAPGRRAARARRRAVSARRVLRVSFMPARVRHLLLRGALHRTQVRLPPSRTSINFRDYFYF